MAIIDGLCGVLCAYLHLFQLFGSKLAHEFMHTITAILLLLQERLLEQTLQLHFACIDHALGCVQREATLED